MKEQKEQSSIPAVIVGALAIGGIGLAIAVVLGVGMVSLKEPVSVIQSTPGTYQQSGTGGIYRK